MGGKKRKQGKGKRRKRTKKSVKRASSGSGPRCGLCGKRENLTRTPCCGNWICDDVHRYVPFSYSRVSCYRNHDQYTLCAVHFHEEHEADDWRTCSECREYFDKTEEYVWRGTNEYNFVKLEKPPSFEPTRCAECGAVINLGNDAYAIDRGEYYCERCTPVNLP